MAADPFFGQEAQMDQQGAAREQVAILRAFNEGPLFVGSSTLPGRTIKTLEPPPADNVKRYTDCYLSQREFGNTGETYKFVQEMLPSELCHFLKCETSGMKQQTQGASDQLNTLLAAEDEDEEGEQDGEKSESDHEDEFEDLEDDDYNAEKYFNDGDDYGDGDDGDDEAAY